LDNYVELISYILSLIVIIDWSEKARVTGVKEVSNNANFQNRWQLNFTAVNATKCFMQLGYLLQLLHYFHLSVKTLARVSHTQLQPYQDAIQNATFLSR